MIVCNSKNPINSNANASKDIFILNNNSSLSCIPKTIKTVSIKNNQSSIPSFNLQEYSLSQLEAIYIGYQCFNNSCSQVTFKSRKILVVNYEVDMPTLKRIEIGYYCFRNVRIFEIDNMAGLENIVVGYSSFNMNGGERSDGRCRICNCPNLKMIYLSSSSFGDFKYFEVSNLKSLQSIHITSGFRYADFALQRKGNEQLD